MGDNVSVSVDNVDVEIVSSGNVEEGEHKTVLVASDYFKSQKSLKDVELYAPLYKDPEYGAVWLGSYRDSKDVFFDEMELDIIGWTSKWVQYT